MKNRSLLLPGAQSLTQQVLSGYPLYQDEQNWTSPMDMA